MWTPFVGLFTNVRNTIRVCFSLSILRRECSKKGEVLGVPNHLEALELILSSPMCIECEFFNLDCDENVYDSLESGVSSPQMASSLRQLREDGFVEFDVGVSVRNQFQLHKHVLQKLRSAQPDCGVVARVERLENPVTAHGAKVCGRRSGTK